MGIHTREKYIVLGLDSGRDKTGFAFVNGEGRLIVSEIFPSCRSNECNRVIEDWIRERPELWLWLMDRWEYTLGKNI